MNAFLSMAGIQTDSWPLKISAPIQDRLQLCGQGLLLFGFLSHIPGDKACKKISYRIPFTAVPSSQIMLQLELRLGAITIPRRYA